MPLPDNPDQLVLHLEGFDGPLDLLLDLARSQKVDLATVSILSLVDQFLAVIEGARQVRLELAADWLVMAAWLAWLKSRLLLPAGEPGVEDAEIAAEILASRLRDLSEVRKLAGWLQDRKQLGRDVFARGAPESLTELDRTRLSLDMPGLLRAYLAALRRGGAGQPYRPRPPALWSVQDALARLDAMLPGLPAWSDLEFFLPPSQTALERRGALASTLIAGLELAKSGSVRLRQDDPFGPILLRGGAAQEACDDA
jgi:segregation and condensation protein A